LQLLECEDRLQDAEKRELKWRRKYETIKPRWCEQVKPIIHRLRSVEETLHSHVSESEDKSRLIESQRQRIEALESANTRLLSNLMQKRQEKSLADCSSVSVKAKTNSSLETATSSDFLETANSSSPKIASISPNIASISLTSLRSTEI